MSENASASAELPRFRKLSVFGMNNAYTEGWALYAERLAAENGWYDGDLPGRLGYFGDRLKEIKGGEAHTTNNRMELMAAITALETLKKACRVELYTDSQYLREGIMSWISNWKRNGWRTADKKPVKNVDLWQRLDAALKRHDVRWHWVRGHAGDLMNERADQLARDAIAEIRAAARQQ